MQERLQKFLSECGIASRRASEEIIKKGFISVNGIVVKEMGIKIDPEKDIVKYKGEILKRQSNIVYIMLNKPKGYITTMCDQFGRPSVKDLIKNVQERIYPVGRLDYDSSGLLIFTNDGDTAYKLTHPGHEIQKEYIVKVKGTPEQTKIEMLRSGIIIDGKKTAPAKVDLLNSGKSYALLRFKIHEGRNRQIRKMCSAIGHDVVDLKRVAIGKIKLGNLKKGEWRYMTQEEIDYLKSL